MGNKASTNTQNAQATAPTAQALIEKAQANGVPAISEYEEIISDGEMPF